MLKESKKVVDKRKAAWYDTKRCCWDKKQPGELGNAAKAGRNLARGWLPAWTWQTWVWLSGQQQQRTLKTEQYVKPWKFLLKMAIRFYGHEWEHSEWKPKTTVERFKISQAKFWTWENSKTLKEGVSPRGWQLFDCIRKALRKSEASTWEFDPGSGWTLAACLTHASRAKRFWGSLRMELELTERRTGE